MGCCAMARSLADVVLTKYDTLSFEVKCVASNKEIIKPTYTIKETL